MNLGRLKRYFAFIAVGLPAFALAVPLNYLFVEFLHLHKALSYAFVLLAQVTLNFFMCKAFVFESTSEDGLVRQYVNFMAGIAAFRVLDWGLYWFAVEILGLYYLLVQIANVFIFSVGKFLFARRVFEVSKKAT